ncbi:MAG TPA: hypothetical protein DEP84_29865 [Chloroflexi bacterium]|nr:hypothetical protein [Chloroflexota bacterium]
MKGPKSEIYCDFGPNFLFVLRGWKPEIQDLAQGQAVLADPEFALAGHIHIGLGQAQAHAGRELALPGQVFLHLIAHVAGVGAAVNVKRET